MKKSPDRVDALVWAGHQWVVKEIGCQFFTLNWATGEMTPAW